jgi:hypothetical protein
MCRMEADGAQVQGTREWSGGTDSPRLYQSIHELHLSVVIRRMWDRARRTTMGGSHAGTQQTCPSVLLHNT